MYKNKTLHIKKDITTEDLSYLAGLIDGEGHIGLHKVKELRRQNLTISYEPIVKVAMAEPESIFFIKECFGGRIFVRDVKNYKSQYIWQTQYIWQINRKSEIKKILCVLLPFLKVKRKFALLLLDYIDLRENKRKISWKNNYDNKETILYNQYKNFIKGEEELKFQKPKNSKS